MSNPALEVAVVAPTPKLESMPDVTLGALEEMLMAGTDREEHILPGGWVAQCETTALAGLPGRQVQLKSITLLNWRTRQSLKLTLE